MRAAIHDTASINAGRLGSRASRQHVHVCPSRDLRERGRVALRGERVGHRTVVRAVLLGRAARDRDRDRPLGEGVAQHRADEARDPLVAAEARLLLSQRRRKKLPDCRKQAVEALRVAYAARAASRARPGWRPCRCASRAVRARRSAGATRATRAAGVERRGRVRLVAVDGLDQGRAHRRNPFFPAHRIEEPRQARVLRVLRAVVDDEQRRVDARRLGRRVEEHVERARRAVGSAARPARSGPASAVDPSQAGRARTRATRSPTCRRTARLRASGLAGSGRKAPSMPSRYSSRSAFGRGKVQPPAPAVHANGGPGRGRATSCPSTTALEAALGIGQREGDRVLVGRAAGSALLRFGRFARSRILYSRTRSCRAGGCAGARRAASSRCSFT